MMAAVDPRLYDFCTERQREYLEAWNEHGSAGKASEATGWSKGLILRAHQVAKKKAALHGYCPDHDMHRPAAPGFHVKGTSTLYDKDGHMAAQWVKTAVDAEARKADFEAAAEAMAEELPRLPALAKPRDTFTDLANVYTLTDCHIGMLAWRKEGGEDWDLAIAEKTLIGSFEQMVAGAPPAHTAIVAQLGDFLHYDGLIPVTPTSGHILDSDGRFSKMVQVAIRVLRRVIDMALQKHERVILVPAEGNHDMASSVWLRHMFKALYENEPRLDVIDSELPYYAYQHGEVMLCWHHSHLKKLDQLPLMMAAQFPAIWGATRKRYAHTGDKHHVEEKEHSGMIVTQHPTLAARDAYASRHGWHALRSATATTYHRQFGRVATNTVCPEMLA